jgi:mono/diheme cytochrome c family protein
MVNGGLMIVCRLKRAAGTALMVIAVAACGDPDTTDDRGYTKAPLEKPSLLVSGEQPGDMARYGAPNRVEADELQLPEEVAVTEPEGGAVAVDLPGGVTQEMVTSGQEIFGGAGMCFACHGANGTGSPLAPSLNESTWLHIDGSFDAIVGLVNAGVPTPMQYPAAMLPRGGSAITDEQVREVAAYVYSISR